MRKILRMPVWPRIFGCLNIIPFSLVCYVNGQSFRAPASAVFSGLGAFSKNFTDVFAAAQDPAATTGTTGFGAGIYGERKFLLKELSEYSLLVNHERLLSNIGLQLQYAGFGAYNESMAGLSYGRNLGKLRVGIQFNYHHITIGGYGSASAYSADISFIWELTPRFRAGIHAINPVPVFFGPDRSEQYPSIYKLGMGYEVSDKCFVAMQVNSETGKTVDVSFALQYQVVSRLLIKMGVNTDVGRPFVSIGWLLGKLRVSMTASYHPTLGFTPGLMLTSANKSKS